MIYQSGEQDLSHKNVLYVSECKDTQKNRSNKKNNHFFHAHP